MPDPSVSLNVSSSDFSAERYQHHHAKWLEAQRLGDASKSYQHLYALRAHLHALGWLAAEYDQPGYGVPNHA